jgi:hypothetical protein
MPVLEGSGFRVVDLWYVGGIRARIGCATTKQSILIRGENKIKERIEFSSCWKASRCSERERGYISRGHVQDVLVRYPRAAESKQTDKS